MCLWNKLIVSTSEQEVSLEPEEALIEVEGEGACGLFFGSGEEWDEMQVRVLKGRGVLCIIFWVDWTWERWVLLLRLGGRKGMEMEETGGHSPPHEEEGNHHENNNNDHSNNEGSADLQHEEEESMAKVDLSSEQPEGVEMTSVDLTSQFPARRPVPDDHPVVR